MKRGELYRVSRGNIADTKKQRVFAIVSRQAAIDSKYSTVICAPVYTTRLGLSTQVEVGPEVGLKHESALHCDTLVSIPKTDLSDYIGRLSVAKMRELDEALAVALAIENR